MTKGKKITFFKSYREINFENVLLEMSFETDLNDQGKYLTKNLEKCVNLELERKLCALPAFQL